MQLLCRLPGGGIGVWFDFLSALLFFILTLTILTVLERSFWVIIIVITFIVRTSMQRSVIRWDTKVCHSLNFFEDELIML